MEIEASRGEISDFDSLFESAVTIHERSKLQESVPSVSSRLEIVIVAVFGWVVWFDVSWQHRKCYCPAKVLAPTKSPSPSKIPATDFMTITCPYLDFKRNSPCKSYNAVLNGECLVVASRKGCDIERVMSVSNCYFTCRMFHEWCCCLAYAKLGGWGGLRLVRWKRYMSEVEMEWKISCADLRFVYYHEIEITLMIVTSYIYVFCFYRVTNLKRMNGRTMYLLESWMMWMENSRFA